MNMIKKWCLAIFFVMVVGFLLSIQTVAAAGRGQVLGETSPEGSLMCRAEVLVPQAPVPIRAEDSWHLVYELLITNMGRTSLFLDRLEVLNDNGQILSVFEGDPLTSIMSRFFDASEGSDIREIPKGSRSVVFAWVSIDNESDIPDHINHRLFFNGGDDREAPPVVLTHPVVALDRTPPRLIAPPVVGEGWLAAEAPSSVKDFCHHRFGVITMEGKTRVPQRYAVDWVKFGPDGRLVKGDPRKNENWYCYGEPIHSVADGVVIKVVDGIPDNIPLAVERVVPITMETVGGNYVLADIGGAHAFYGHMISGSIRVKEGDVVRAGQVLGLLGNSGNSDAPHLHFHINSAPSVFPLAAEGLPYVHASLVQTGFVPIPLSEDIEFFDDVVWKNKADFEPVSRANEMPLGYRIYTINPGRP